MSDAVTMTQKTPVTLRPATALDAGRTGWILYRFAQDTPWMPKLYSEAETISFCGVMIEQGWVTVAEQGGQTLGFLARDGEEVCSLYLAPECCGRGIGRALLGQAQAAQPRLWLRAFVANRDARRFYQREGFYQTGRSDGAENEEGLPDVTLAWPQPKDAGQAGAQEGEA